MLCRSPGCDSKDHFQYSGRCPVEQARRKAGTSAIFMASTVETDLANGEDILGVLCEILYSKIDEESEAMESELLDAPELPGGVSADAPPVNAGFVDFENNYSADCALNVFGNSSDENPANIFYGEHTLNEEEIAGIEPDDIFYDARGPPSNENDMPNFCQGRLRAAEKVCNGSFSYYFSS